MTSSKDRMCIAALMLLAFVCHAATGSNANDGDATALAISVNAADDSASIPDFDGDGTIGFGDFLIFAGVFGARQGDEKYEGKYDLNGDGEIGFSDFLIFAENFGKEAPSPVVANPDANLRAAIEAALNKESGAPIIQAEMATLDSLAASDAEITDLTGLESAVNLTYLSLNDNDITDIPALSELTILERLWLSNNRIEDISALAKLTNLTELWLWNNQIEDISTLANLTGLTQLSLGRNMITDISALSGLINLNTLILRSNRISDLAPLAANKGLARGVTVDVTDNPLNATSESTHIPALQARGVSVSFTPSPTVSIPDANLRAAIEAALNKASGAPITQAEMATLDSLVSTAYGREGIRSLSGIESATNVWKLNLRNNSITDISALAGLNNLTYLRLGGNELTDISPLAGLTNLTWLDLERNDITDVAPLSGLSKLTRLDLWSNRIRDISPLAGLTNLTELGVGANHLADVSALAGLTNLRTLWLAANNITDISPLAGLTNLRTLWLRDNELTDISPLAGLTKLRRLSLSENNITDISPLAGLTGIQQLNLGFNPIVDISALSGLTRMGELNLEATDITDISALAALTGMYGQLDLGFNFISDISALSGLTNLRELDLRGNPLGDSSIDVHIPFHERNGATVTFNSLREGDFDIELVFLDSFTERHKRVFQFAARRWMSAITEDLPDYEFTQGWSGRCGGQSYEISAGERIDDLRIYVISFDQETFKDEGYSSAAWASSNLLRDETHLPVVGCMGFGFFSVGPVLVDVGLHEVGHVLGFGTVWNDLGFFQNPPGGDEHFNGPLAIAAFDDAGGGDYTGAKVPVEFGFHWRSSVLEAELMGGMQLWRPSGAALSAITVQSFADLGYGVDVSQADAYTLPRTTSGAKVAVSTPAVPGFDANVFRPDVYTLPVTDPHWQGGTSGRAPLPRGNGRTGPMDSAERVWGRGITFDLPDRRQIWRTGSPSFAEPKLTCGGGLMNEPIYVVDPQGRIVRTINR